MKTNDELSLSAADADKFIRDTEEHIAELTLAVAFLEKALKKGRYEKKSAAAGKQAPACPSQSSDTLRADRTPEEIRLRELCSREAYLTRDLVKKNIAMKRALRGGYAYKVESPNDFFARLREVFRQRPRLFRQHRPSPHG